jgi:hypothetical protein
MSKLRVDQLGKIVNRGVFRLPISVLLSASPRLRVIPRFAVRTLEHCR